jgi:hypothetical protein
MAGPERSPARTGRKKSDEGGEALPPAEVMVRPHVPAIALPARLARLDVRGRLDELAIYGEDEVGLLDEAARMCSAGEVRSAIEERAVTIRRDLAARAKVAREEERNEGLIWRGPLSVRRPVDPETARQLREAWLLEELAAATAEEELAARHKAEKADMAARRNANKAALLDIAEGKSARPCECSRRVVGGDTVTYLDETGEEIGRVKATEDDLEKARQRRLFPGGW